MSASFPPCQVGRGVILKKSHPCGGQRRIVYKPGLDVGLQCEQCGQGIKPARRKFEPAVDRGMPHQH